MPQKGILPFYKPTYQVVCTVPSIPFLKVAMGLTQFKLVSSSGNMARCALWMVSRVEVNEWYSECAPRSTTGGRAERSSLGAVSPDKEKE